MSMTPDIAMNDLVAYVTSEGHTLSNRALETFMEMEHLGFQNNIYLFPHDFLLPLIKRSPKLANIINRNGGNSVLAIKWLEEYLREEFGERDTYQDMTELYSTKHTGGFQYTRDQVINKCIELAKSQFRKEVNETDIILSILECHEEAFPIIENGNYTDRRFHTLYNTLSHMIAEYCECLWVKIDIVKNEIPRIDDRAYDLAISFAGEDRMVAKNVADLLRNSGYTVFYDEFEKATLWGKDLYTHLIDVYSKKARFCLMIISEHYAKKQWTSLERKAAQERAYNENREYILPLRIDDTQIPGVLTTTGYIDLRNIQLEEVVELLKQKISGYYAERLS